MPRKLRKALGAVKDQTSIGLAKFSSTNCANLDVAVLKATTHEELPMEDRYVNEVLLLVSSSKAYANACVVALAKRIGRTRNWIVALKSLMLVFKLFQEGDPHFPLEVVHAMKRGDKLLNLSGFRDETNSSPWDFTAFVRTFALYLDERLDCSLMGKLQGAMSKERDHHYRRRRNGGLNGVGPLYELKPLMILDKITYWQRLLDRVLATRPTGPAKTNRLVQISLYAIVRESFDLYRDISEGLTLLLDSFFHLQHQACVDAFETCSKAAKQFDELAAYYALCKNIGVGRTSEYPSVQKISDKLLETLQEFLKDNQTSLHKPKIPELQLPAPIVENPTDSEPSDEASKQCESENEIDIAIEEDETETDMALTTISHTPNQEDLIDVGYQENDMDLGLVLFGDDQKQENRGWSSSLSGKGWELVLVESASNISNSSSNQVNYSMAGGFDSLLLESLYDQAALYHHSQNYINPFLHSGSESSLVLSMPSFSSSLVPTPSPFLALPAPPTFCAQNSTQSPIETDPFSASVSIPPPTMVQMSDLAMKQELMVQEQQMWMQYQNKIIGRQG